MTLSERYSSQPCDLIITWTKGQRTVRCIFSLRTQAQESDILGSFAKLVASCRTHSQGEVTETEVARVLLRHKGDVKKTLEDFAIT